MKINQLKIGVILSYVSIVLNLIINLVYTPVMIRLLGQCEYGLYTLVSSFVSYLSLFSLGFTGSYLRFYAKAKSNNDKKGEAKLNGTFLLLFIFMGTLALITGMILASFLPQIFGNKLTPLELHKSKILMQILVVNIFLTFPSTVFDSIIGAHEKFVFQKLINILGIIFNPLINLPLLLMGYDSIMLVLVTTIITIFKLVVNLLYCFKKIKVNISFKSLEFKLLKQLAMFSLFIFLNMIVDQINWSIDKFILGRVSGTRDVGIYGIGATFNTVMLQLSVAVSSVFGPSVNMIVNSKKTNEKKDEELSNLLVKVGRFQYMILLFVTIAFIFVGQSFINWWAGIEYANSYYVALYLILPLAIILPHNLGIEIRRAKNKHQLSAIIEFGIVLINLLISIPLARYYGAPGSAFGTLIGNIIYIIFLDFYYIRVIHLDMKKLYKNLLNITICVLPAIIFGLIGLMQVDLKFNIFWAILYLILYCIFLYKLAMNESEKKNIDKVLYKLHLKK